MRTLIDVSCPACGVSRDVWRDGPCQPPCPRCGGATERCWATPAASAAVHGEIDLVVKHGLCWPDGTPRRFESRQALARAERASGLTNAVTHLGGEGSDKSSRTQRFV